MGCEGRLNQSEGLARFMLAFRPFIHNFHPLSETARAPCLAADISRIEFSHPEDGAAQE
jgi:hypothetical protein